MTIAIENFPDEWKKCPIRNNGYPHILQFLFKEQFNPAKYEEIVKLSDFHKLSNNFTKDAVMPGSFGDLFFKQKFKLV